MQTQLWIGTTSKMVLAPLPALPLEAPLVGYAEVGEFEDGGADADHSAAQSKRYEFNVPIEDASELSQYRRLRQGSYGTGLIYFPDPIAQRINLFPPHWAEPGLLEAGWPDIYDTAPSSFADVSTNSYDQPLRKATWAVTNTNTAPSEDRSVLVIPIPPSETLWLGASGAATGTAVVHVEAVNIAAGSSAGSNLTLLADTSSTRLNASFAGSSYDYVTVEFRRTSSAASTLTLTSMLAQLWPTGTTPTLTGDHRPGEGHSGCRFAGPQFGTTVRRSDDDVQYSGVSFGLVEVGGWR